MIPLARKNDDYLDRVNQALLDEEEEEVLPAAPVSPIGHLRNADRTDVDPEELAEELEEKQNRTPIILLILLLFGAVFVGLALWLKYAGGLPW